MFWAFTLSSHPTCPSREIPRMEALDGEVGDPGPSCVSNLAWP